MNKPTAKTLDTKEVQAETEKASSRILDLIALKGQVTRARASLLECSHFKPEGKVHQVHHPWSVYDVSVEDMEKAMARMRKSFPENGWTIVKDGPDESAAKTPTIVANSDDGKLSAEIQLLDERARGKTSVLAVTVVSTCFQSKPET
ncbi:hypothetical protein [Streptomyces sp. G-G2]|uniref:hypothetical protein n=1 Tax=Streptomyces sp. G-G2 TaxID=3046201 RepID=UPI0024B9E471|nr:hypothetical protein [Streptomyces sp. G-G2]MDJ0380712.1 hypothetical protein [Streptomyces sp. G-G2]